MCIPLLIISEVVCFYAKFFNILYFLSSFRFTEKLRGRDVPHTPAPHVHARPTVTTPHWSSTLVTMDEPTRTRHYHSESIVYITSCSWCHGRLLIASFVNYLLIFLVHVLLL